MQSEVDVNDCCLGLTGCSQVSSVPLCFTCLFAAYNLTVLYSCIPVCHIKARPREQIKLAEPPTGQNPLFHHFIFI